MNTHWGKVIAIVGPTATGKSEVAVSLAQKLGNAEIISADSMQVYRHMDIGTAKPTLELQRTIPHHLLDIIDPDQEFSVAHYQRAARAKITEIAGRGRVPILVGGSGLYVRAALDPLDFPAAAPDTPIRAELEVLGRKEPTKLLEKLAAVDPDAASNIDLKNTRRVIRAIEAKLNTSATYTARRTAWASWDSLYETLRVGLITTRDQERARIRSRVDQMMAQGLERETRALVGRFAPLSRTARQALGYRELLARFESGSDLEETIELIKVKTCQFAKRQRTWFKRDPRLIWFDATDQSPACTADEIISLVNTRSFIVS